jgi:hypothetical protein
MGASTMHRVRMTICGWARVFRMRVEEPEPGRVLTESDEASWKVTTWVVTRTGRAAEFGWRPRSSTQAAHLM